MTAVQVSSPGGAFEIVDREIPEPEADEVRIKVQACGVCYGDAVTKEGEMPGLDIEYPRIPGHEVVGRIDALGADVTDWEVGQRVGVGWHGGHCFVCDRCRSGDFTNCEKKEITGITTDGGYAEYMCSSREALTPVPAGLDSTAAAPLVCAGMTAFNALRRSGAKQGDLVAVQGIGGVGHMGIQYANAAGYETVALSRGTEKRELAFELGAHHYIDAVASDPAEELQSLGGADVVFSTAPSSAAIESITGGLAANGTLLVVAVPHEPVELDLAEFVNNRRSMQGWDCGHAYHAQDTLECSELNDIEPMISTYSLTEADEAYAAMKSSDTRFKAVLQPPQHQS